MERSPVIGWLFHVRILTLLGLLAQADIYFIHHAYQFTTSKGPSVQLVFGFEYSILIIMISNILIKVSFLFQSRSCPCQAYRQSQQANKNPYVCVSSRVKYLILTQLLRSSAIWTHTTPLSIESQSKSSMDAVGTTGR